MRKLLVFDTGAPRDACGADEIQKCLKAGERFWMDITGPEEADYRDLASSFNIPQIQIEEIRSEQSLPKLRRSIGLTFLSWYAVDPARAEPAARFDCILSDGFLVTVHQKEIDILDRTFKLMSDGKERRDGGPERALYELLDAAVDAYFLLVDDFSDETDELEDVMFAEPGSKDVKRLFSLKRQMLELRKVVAPEREVINSILRREQSFVSNENIAYYEDLYNHLVRIIDLIDTLRDVASGAMQIYQATISNNLNAIMKTLTVIATITMPISMIAGIYGMNFHYMPELAWRYGYFYVLAIMVSIVTGMLYWFWHRKWL